MRNRLFALVIFLGMFGFYLTHASPSVTAGDSGEFITAIGTLSIPHAPSFPLYSLLGRCVTDLLPVAALPYRCNVFSALCAAATLAILFLMLADLGVDLFSSLMVPVVIGLTVSFWENALVTEVFALNSLFAAMLLACLAKRSYALFAFLLGLGLGNHQILLFIAPAAVIPVAPAIFRPGPISTGKMDPGLRHAGMTNLLAGATKLGILFLIGFSIYLYLPIRAAKQPPLDWGQPTTVAKFTRTITRADYGSMKLATGETPDRNLSNSARHIGKFFQHLIDEVPLPAVLLGLWALVIGILIRDRWAYILAGVFALTGPFFFLLGNLPFTAQSDGIVGRFMILPSMALLLAAPLAIRNKKIIGQAVLFVCIALAFQKNIAQAAMHRSSMLVLDYGRSMLRSLPLNTSLFLDGGDDAFYSLAMLHYVEGRRPDVEIHDRGGLVFANPYGGDFRMIGKEEKQKRRWAVEQTYLARGPLYYGTMDRDVLPGIGVIQAGFLMKVAADPSRVIDWSMLVLRSLYPLEPDNYRTRALGTFFPFMHGRLLLAQGKVTEALRQFHRAEAMGPDIDWFRNNMEAEYAKLGYDMLMAGKFADAERVYRDAVAFNPESFQTQSNLGVALEKQGRIAEAKAQYQLTANKFPSEAGAVFNLAVLAWKEHDWAGVVSCLEEVLRRQPNHPDARRFLHQAFKNMVKHR